MVEIRDARAADAGAIGRVGRASWRSTYSGLADPRLVARFTGRYAAGTVAADVARCARRPADHFLVAEGPEGIVGFLHFERGYLWRLYLRPDRRGAGLGGRLLDELHRRLGPGAEYELDVHAENHPARRFYARRGFAPTGEGAWPFALLRARTG